MMVMPSNTRGIVTGWLAGRFPGRLGHLYSIEGMTRAYEFMPYALDNGRFPCWAAGLDWDSKGYRDLLERARDCGQKPIWALVPDVVGNCLETQQEWDHWEPRLRDYGWPLAFAVQDGMVPKDVPPEADVIFVGGSTNWKRKTLHEWCEAFPRVHVGRINTDKWLWECHEAGAESVDGTGFMRGDQRQLQGLITYLERSTEGLGNNLGERLF